MKKLLFPCLLATTLFAPFALIGCGSNEDNVHTEEMHKDHDDHDHHGHHH